MKCNIFSTFTLVLGRFLHGSGSGFFRIVFGFLGDPDPDSEKKSDPDPGKKPGSETLEKVQKYFLHAGFMHTVECTFIFLTHGVVEPLQFDPASSRQNVGYGSVSSSVSIHLIFDKYKNLNIFLKI